MRFSLIDIFQNSIWPINLIFLAKANFRRTLILMSLLPFTVVASIQEVKTMEEVSTYFADADASTLAVFDIDMVLIQPADPIFQMRNMIRHKHIAKKILSTLSENEQITFFSLETIRSYPILIDTYTNVLLEDLKNRQIKTIANTANLTGSFAGKENMQAWVNERLCMCGINFSHSFPCEGEIVFRNLPTHRGNYMVYSKGILFTNGLSNEKGTILSDFLHRVNFAPRKVIFIDDRLDNLQTAEPVLTKMGIEFVGLHYTGAKNYPSPLIDEERFEQVWLKRAEEAKILTQSDEMHILPLCNQSKF